MTKLRVNYQIVPSLLSSYINQLPASRTLFFAWSFEIYTTTWISILNCRTRKISYTNSGRCRPAGNTHLYRQHTTAPIRCWSPARTRPLRSGSTPWASFGSSAVILHVEEQTSAAAYIMAMHACVPASRCVSYGDVSHAASMISSTTWAMGQPQWRYFLTHPWNYI